MWEQRQRYSESRAPSELDFYLKNGQILGIAVLKTGIVFSCLSLLLAAAAGVGVAAAAIAIAAAASTVARASRHRHQHLIFWNVRFTNSIPNWQQDRLLCLKPNDSQRISIHLAMQLNIKQEVFSPPSPLSLSLCVLCTYALGLVDLSIGWAKDH